MKRDPPNPEKKFEKTLDKLPKPWYNNYEKEKENSTNQKGIYYEEGFSGRYQECSGWLRFL